MKEYPEETLDELSIKDLRLISKDISLHAKYFAYEGITENSSPSPEYIQRGWEVCKKLLALAGYRLANYLLELFPNFEW
jgi:hypothetical protein